MYNQNPFTVAEDLQC